MVETCWPTKETWSSVDSLIERWLGARQEVIVLYCSISSLPHYSPRDVSKSVKIQAFCQALIDYVSSGHFDVYEKLVEEGKAFNDGGLEKARELYPRIELSTEASVEFNDRYDTAENCIAQMDRLGQDLSVLGELLVDRFHYEDELIQVLHTSHRDKVA